MTAQTSFGTLRRKDLITIDEILHARPQLPKATTRERGWGGVTVDLHRPYFDCSESYPGLDHHVICYCPSGSSRLVQSPGGKVHEGVISAGMSFLMPAGYDSKWAGDSGLSARLRIPASLVAAAAEQVGARSTSQAEIRNVFQVRDPVVERMALTLLDEMDLQPHPAQVLIVDTVSTALAAHMLRRYNAFEANEPRHEPSFSAKELGQLLAYVQDNLDRPISLADLAAVVNVSRFHFTRLFKRSTGSTAISFVERCRIGRAQTLIAETDLPLAHIALATGFTDQSHFTRRFHRHAGCTPAVFACKQGRRRSARRPPSHLQ
jgi:AraC family transcriptional regulator